MKFCIATSCLRTHTNLCNSNQYYCHYTIMYSSSLWLSAQNHSHFDALLSGFDKPALHLLYFLHFLVMYWCKYNVSTIFKRKRNVFIQV